MIESVFRILALMHKEFLAMFKDPKSRITMIVPPILQSLIFGYAATFDLNDVPYAVLDHDRSAASVALTAQLDGSGIFTRLATLQRATDIAEFIDSGRVIFVLTIDRDFERDLMAGRIANVQIVADGRNSNTSGTAQSYASTIVSDFLTRWKQENGWQGGSGVIMTTRTWYNPQLETRWYMIPSLLGTITMMMTMMLTGMSVAREREAGTFDQLMVAPFHQTEIMIGKAVPAMLVGLMQATMILLVAQLWFRLPFAGSYAVLYLGLTLFILASVGIGLFISSIALNLQQAMIFSFVVLMPFMMLSGLTSPVANMPMVLQYATLINPLRYAISIAQQIYLEGAGLTQLFPEMSALVVIIVITLPFATWMFRHRLV